MIGKWLTNLKQWRHQSLRCRLCGLEPRLVSHGLCRECQCDLPRRDRTLTLRHNLGPIPCHIFYEYVWPMDYALHQYKIQKRLELAPLLVDCITAHHPTAPLIAQAIAAVPSSPDRLQERGFDAMHELVKVLAGRWQLPIYDGIKRHPHSGRHQRGLSRAERITNLSDNPFYVSRPVPANLLILDDVLATGTTLARVLDALQMRCTTHSERFLPTAMPRCGVLTSNAKALTSHAD